MKVRSYKKQIEEVEEIAALNLAKYRQTQGNLGEAEQRADLNDQALAKIKAHDRAASMGPLVGNTTFSLFSKQKYFSKADE